MACVHPALGITGPDAISSGAFADRVSQRLGVTHTIAEPIAHMQDADLFVTTAFFHGLLEDLPTLRLAILHAGTSWVPLALEKSETYLWLSPQFAMAFVCLEPEEVWDRHPLVVSFDSWEESVRDHARPPRRQGGWGSRYPNHDAAGPDEAIEMLEAHAVDAATIDRLMSGNAADLFRLPGTREQVIYELRIYTVVPGEDGHAARRAFRDHTFGSSRSTASRMSVTGPPRSAAATTSSGTSWPPGPRRSAELRGRPSSPTPNGCGSSRRSEKDGVLVHHLGTGCSRRRTSRRSVRSDRPRPGIAARSERPHV